MIDRVTFFGLIAAIGAFFFILELVRRRKLREDYSLLWLVTAGVLILLALLRPLLDQVAIFIGVVTYPPAALFIVAILFLLFLLLQFSIALSKLTRENQRIAQEMALLRQEVQKMKRSNE